MIGPVETKIREHAQDISIELASIELERWHLNCERDLVSGELE